MVETRITADIVECFPVLMRPLLRARDVAMDSTLGYSFASVV